MKKKAVTIWDLWLYVFRCPEHGNRARYASENRYETDSDGRDSPTMNTTKAVLIACAAWLGWAGCTDSDLSATTQTNSAVKPSGADTSESDGAAAARSPQTSSTAITETCAALEQQLADSMERLAASTPCPPRIEEPRDPEEPRPFECKDYALLVPMVPSCGTVPAAFLDCYRQVPDEEFLCNEEDGGFELGATSVVPATCTRAFQAASDCFDAVDEIEGDGDYEDE